MPRPFLKRRINSNPNVVFYKPRGIPLRELKTIKITLEEWESLRLKDVENMNQIDAARSMNTSQSTFQRILTRAHKKISFALVHCMAIQITIDE
ncbi:MAG TPA: DUF134 domain-containing protein [Candidatus Kaiserbacteria bacterium]|nr:DUF134 domain-containing protein [Candidatus Kaiserbacteria bacterium]